MKRTFYTKAMLLGGGVLILIVFSLWLAEAEGDTVSYHLPSILFLSVFGWFLFLVSLLSWKMISGKWFSLYSIFITFAYLFTYGQCLMWAVGIHASDEIGNTLLYTFPAPAEIDIIKTQLVTLVCLYVFHIGAVFGYQGDEKKASGKEPVGTAFNRRSLFQVSVIANIISTPLMFWSIVRNISINSRYGYGAALYNSDVVASQNNIVLLLRLMYIPSIFGMLIASQYDKKIMKTCYLSFGVFTALGVFAGDRGEWLFPLLLLVWMHHKCYKKIDFRHMLRYIVGGLFLIILAVAVRNSRSKGVTVSGLREATIGEKNPVISAVFELGSSMKPTLIVLRYGEKIYPFGNSYFHALEGMVTERVIMLFQPDYTSLSGWFSHTFLRITYGAGFSFVAEAIVNYGKYGGLIALIILGFIFARGFFSLESLDYANRPLKMFLGISTAYAMMQTIRNTLLVGTKTWFFSTILIYLLYLGYSEILRRRTDEYIST